MRLLTAAALSAVLGAGAAAQTAAPAPGAASAQAQAQTEAQTQAQARIQTQPAPPAAILIVNKERVVEASAPAESLRATERRIRARLEAELVRVKSELEAEELELTRLRDTLPREEFQARAVAFDRRVRHEREAAQRRGTLLLNFVSEAQNALRSALPRVLEQLRRDRGATLLLDAGAALAADPDADVTDEAIRRYDAAMEGVSFDPPRELAAPEPPPDDDPPPGVSP